MMRRKLRNPQSSSRMTVSCLLPSLFRLAIVAFFGATVMACAEKKRADACCSWTEMPSSSKPDEDKGILKVEGSTSAQYQVFDEGGQKVAVRRLNESVALDPGTYDILLNGSHHRIEVEEGLLTTCSTGSLSVAGITADSYHVTDSLGEAMAQEVLGRPVSLFPGTYPVKVNNTVAMARVKPRALTELHTGTLVAKGHTEEYYYVLDESNKQLNYSVLGKPLSFFPGRYSLRQNKSSRKALLFASEVQVAATGNMLVKGLTDENY